MTSGPFSGMGLAFRFTEKETDAPGSEASSRGGSVSQETVSITSKTRGS